MICLKCKKEILDKQDLSIGKLENNFIGHVHYFHKNCFSKEGIPTLFGFLKEPCLEINIENLDQEKNRILSKVFKSNVSAIVIFIIYFFFIQNDNGRYFLLLVVCMSILLFKENLFSIIDILKLNKAKRFLKS